MRVINYTEFRSKLAENLNLVSDDGEIVVVSRPAGKNVVVMELDAYNSLQETLHLNATDANRRRLELALGEMNRGKSIKHKLLKK